MCRRRCSRLTYPSKSRKTGNLVAIKIIDIDTVDYQEMTTKNLSETLKEIDILQQLRDSKARPYVNIIEEAKAVHNELWIISEYASGGSVATLMKPMAMLKDPGPGLPEKFIIPIARELALGLKYVHEAGVLHRDMKSNNVLILEDGRVQLCDFGVSGTLEPQKSKRTTIVGTPFWMAPELQREWIKDADPHSLAKPREILYGSEVDIWAYGCTVYEMACGFPPHHRSAPFDLPNAGVPVLEGDRYSPELKDFVSFLLQPDPQDRPTPDEILEHVYLKDSTKMYPTVMLVKLVEDYYVWEQQGGARQSLFNIFGAQAPDPLAPETDDDEDDDWTFSTSDEFEQEHAPQFTDPFVGGAAGQPFTGMGLPPLEDMDRFEQLQARFKEESITRGQKRLNKLFDTETTPYRYSMIDDDDDNKGRPPSDLVLRDFNPGAPNRETVIDLDFSLPSTDNVPNIDLGEVPTIKAVRIKSLLREMAEEDAREIAREKELREQQEYEAENQLTKRATRDWTFPSASNNRKTQDWSFPSMEAPAEEEELESDNRKTMEWSFPAADPPNRKTMDWSFPAAEPPKPNRKTVEWTFDAAMAEAQYDAPRNRTSRRRETKEYSFPAATAPDDDNRSTMDFSFPMRSPSPKRGQNGDYSSPPTLGPGFRPNMRQATTGSQSDGFPRVSSDPNSPLRSSMIDLDMATVEDYRPSTSGSGSAYTGLTYTGSTYAASENPFSLEDQVQLSQNNHRASFHMKSQSEPNHAVPGLLTPQQYDEQGLPTNQDPHHPSMHARGVSSVSQMQAQNKPPATSIPPLTTHRPNQRSQQLWDGWSHTHAYGLNSDDRSPPLSVTTDTSLSEEDVDELWDTFERLTMHAQRKYQSYGPLRSARRLRNSSIDESSDPRTAGLGLAGSDTDDTYPYTAESDSSSPSYAYQGLSRVSAGPNGRPLVDFPIPRGPDVEALLGGDVDVRVLQDALLKSAVELRDGTRASRDLLRAMRLSEVEDGVEEEIDQSTVRLPSRGRE